MKKDNRNIVQSLIYGSVPNKIELLEVVLSRLGDDAGALIGSSFESVLNWGSEDDILRVIKAMSPKALKQACAVHNKGGFNLLASVVAAGREKVLDALLDKMGPDAKSLCVEKGKGRHNTLHLVCTMRAAYTSDVTMMNACYASRNRMLARLLKITGSHVLSERNVHGDSAFHIAALCGDEAIMRQLIESTGYAMAYRISTKKNSESASALQMAIKYNNPTVKKALNELEVFQFLMNPVNYKRESAIILKIKLDSVGQDVAKRLCQETDKRLSPLEYSLIHGNTEHVQCIRHALGDAFSSQCKKIKNGRSALSYAVSSKQSAEVVKMILDAIPDPASQVCLSRDRAYHRFTPLHWAVYNDDLATVNVLLERLTPDDVIQFCGLFINHWFADNYYGMFMTQAIYDAIEAARKPKQPPAPPSEKIHDVNVPQPADEPKREPQSANKAPGAPQPADEAKRELEPHVLLANDAPPQTPPTSGQSPVSQVAILIDFNQQLVADRAGLGEENARLRAQISAMQAMIYSMPVPPPPSLGFSLNPQAVSATGSQPAWTHPSDSWLRFFQESPPCNTPVLQPEVLAPSVSEARQVSEAPPTYESHSRDTLVAQAPQPALPVAASLSPDPVAASPTQKVNINTETDSEGRVWPVAPTSTVSLDIIEDNPGAAEHNPGAAEDEPAVKEPQRIGLLA